MGLSQKQSLLRFLLIVVGVLGLAFVTIYLLYSRDVARQMDRDLHEMVDMAAGMFSRNQMPAEPPSFVDARNPLSLTRSFRENVTVYDLRGSRIFTFNPSPADLDPEILNLIRLYKEYRFSHAPYEALGVLYSDPYGTQVVVVAESIPDPGSLASLFVILTIVFVCLVAMILAGGWFFARQTLQSVGDLSNQLKGLAPGDLGRRLSADSQRQELHEMVTTFNGLLDRIQEAFRVQKMFLANISHEMRSPLQAMMTGIENTLSRDRSEQEYRQRMVSLLDDLRDLNRVADNLMTLAKEESDQTIVLFKSFRIDDLIWQSRASLVKMHPEYQVLFEIASLPEEEAALSRQGNELLLKTALLNLMDNGCKFSPDHSVMVRLSWEKGCPVISIRDHGPGIPEEERGRILTPFYRVPATAHVRGSGVGLALVRGILDLHHIRLDIGDHADGGAEFRLWFPAA